VGGNPRTIRFLSTLGFWKLTSRQGVRLGGSQIVETLGGVFVSQALDTFQLDHQHIFDEDIGKVFSDGVAFVGNCK
jgi:hypothetical protein